MRRLIICLLLAAPSGAQSPASAFKAGEHYFSIQQPFAVRDPKKIEVLEIFRYGCVNCYRFDAQVRKWQGTLAQDVELNRLPVVWNAETYVQAQAFYTAHALGKVDVIHEKIFAAIWEDPAARGRPLNSDARIRKIFMDQGVDAAAFDKAFASPQVTARVDDARAQLLSYKPMPGDIDFSTPELLIAGKYRISGLAFLDDGEEAAYRKMLEVADFLISQERSRRKPAP